MSYVEQCLKEHIDQLKYKEAKKERELIKLQAELATIAILREDLENGLNNWIDEERELHK